MNFNHLIRRQPLCSTNLGEHNPRIAFVDSLIHVLRQAWFQYKPIARFIKIFLSVRVKTRTKESFLIERSPPDIYVCPPKFEWVTKQKEKLQDLKYSAACICVENISTSM